MKRSTLFNLLVTLALALALLSVGRPARADTYTVTTTNDSGAGSLRQAIIDANGNPGPDTIEFNISGSGVHTITLSSGLPVLINDGTTINGYSQPGASEATDATSATLKIVIDGNKAINDDALYISSANNVIKGLVINNFLEGGIVIWGSNATSNTVCGNYIGTDASGTIDMGNAYSGVSIWSGAQNNIIGGNASGERNLISGNGTGVAILGSGTTSNTICGNYIGTDARGTGALGNTSSGVSISDGAQNNTVGGDTPGERNIISGNENNGVDIKGSDTTGNIVSGNYIGPDADGTAALYNHNNGVYIWDGAHDNSVGGDAPGERNVISGNQYNGVSIGANTIGAYNNTVCGNYIGTDASGTTALGNYNGVRIHSGAHNNTIGGDTPGERNVISGNSQKGVVIEGSGTMGNTVSGNYIGPNANNTAKLVSQYGVYIWDSAQNNKIGGSAPDKGNVISGSYYDGVLIYGSGAKGNTISANSIHDNGSQGIHLQNGGNTELMAPTIISATATGASGTGCAWCTIHIYSDEEDEGETWHAPSVNADASGNWTYSGVISGPYATATNTDSDGNTSEFSAPKEVGEKHDVYLPLVLKN